MHACTHACTLACTHARKLARAHARTHARTHACTFACTHARMHACTHACTHARMHARNSMQLTHALFSSITTFVLTKRWKTIAPKRLVNGVCPSASRSTRVAANWRVFSQLSHVGTFASLHVLPDMSIRNTISIGQTAPTNTTQQPRWISFL